MPTYEVTKFLGENQILALLPSEERKRLMLHLQPVRLDKGQILYVLGHTMSHAYFLMSGMVSLVSTTAEGNAVEIGMIGNEGMAGLPVILRNNTSPYNVIVQLPGNALQIRAAALKAEFDRGLHLYELLLGYTNVLLLQIAQSASCNRFHTMEARLCRWLLIGRDRVGSNTLNFTQEFLSHMIGTPRTNVTIIAGNLQKMGLIKYRRGKIQLLDPQGLEAYACECYTLVKEAIDHFRAA
jgi:CRP-like cAMP-binding protein